MRYPLDNVHELGSSPRTGGCFVGPKTDTTAIWKGRPPTVHDGLTPNVISIAMRSTGTLALGASRSTIINAECGNSFGDIITREFAVGEGLSVDLGAGAFQHVRIRAITPIPDQCTLYFSWVNNLSFSSTLATLSNFLDYPVANARVRVPEGAFDMTPESACIVTFTLDSFGTTFTQGVSAGQPIPVRWGTFTCNVPNKFFFRLRGF